MQNTTNPIYKMKWDYRFTFGRYHAMRLDEVFANGWKGKSYIAWVYYNKENIDFADNVLEALGLSRITKPSVAPEKYDEWLQRVPEDERKAIQGYWANVRMGVASHHKAASRNYRQNRLARHEKTMTVLSGAGRLAWQNQGHRD